MKRIRRRLWNVLDFQDIFREFRKYPPGESAQKIEKYKINKTIRNFCRGKTSFAPDVWQTTPIKEK
jgi:hypothetical protein